MEYLPLFGIMLGLIIFQQLVIMYLYAKKNETHYERKGN